MSTGFHEGESAMIQALISGGLVLRLTSSPDPKLSRDSSIKAFVEPAFPGYKSILLSPSLWTLVPGKGSTPSRATCAPVSFIRSRTSIDDPTLVYGWVLTTSTGKLISFRRFDGAPFDVRRERDRIEVAPVLQFSPSSPQG